MHLHIFLVEQVASDERSCFRNPIIWQQLHHTILRIREHKEDHDVTRETAGCEPHTLSKNGDREHNEMELVPYQTSVTKPKTTPPENEQV